MIKKFIRRLLGREAPAAPATEPAAAVVPPPFGQRVEVPPEMHGIDPKLVDDNAVRVVRTLKDAGYEAYIVGGAVRDLLVQLRPKDFDVATDATPEQVKALFRRAFIIGRRFRIVHVVFGRGREHEVIEVSTFRAYLDASASEAVSGNEKTAKAELSDRAHAVDASGRVLRDNVWGPQLEDAARRDFTVNAMYYDPVRRIVVDYHGGLGDARARILRMIGDAPTRYREDPVRILRVVRFAAKLGFAIEPATAAPIRSMTGLLANVPASRLFDEMVKLLQTGHALASVEQLRRHGLDRGVFPVLHAAFADVAAHPTRHKFIELALADTDRRVQEGRAVAPSFLLACLLWHDVQSRWQALRDAGEMPFPALQQAVDAVFDARIGDISGRGKLAIDMREIWLMQPRFDRRTVSSAPGLIGQPRFRAGYDFLRLRADVGEVPVNLADWWEDFHLGDDDEREALLQSLRVQQPPRRVPGPGRAAAADVRDPALEEDPAAVAAPVEGEQEAGPARRRRRRRPRRAAATPGTADSGGSADGGAATD
jgi:poly(A) polymerase